MNSDDHTRRLSVASLVNPATDPPPPPPTMQSEPIIDASDEKVLIAVSALGDMRAHAVVSSPEAGPSSSSNYWSANSRVPSSIAPTPSLSAASTSSRATSPSRDEDERMRAESPDHLLARVQSIPLVNTALSAYNYSKASSRVINYGAGLVESSVKTISRPVIERLPVEQLDEFACRQLDRFGRYGGGPKPETPPPAVVGDERSQSRGRESPRTRARSSSNSTLGENVSEREDRDGDEDVPPGQVQVASRSGWQTVLYEASGIGAAISEENMRRLKYCLKWLQYAVERIDQQIDGLQRFLMSLDSQLASDSTALIPMSTMQRLSDVKKDLVATVRQVVEVLTTHAGNALPEQARASIRSIILILPQRWTQALQQQEEELAAGPAPPPGSPEHGLAAATAQRAAKRVLTLANESLDVMKSATGVFKESLDRADAWVERLRIVGLQRRRQHQQAITGTAPNSPGVNIQGLSISSMYGSTPLGSRRASRSDPDDDDTETEGETGESSGRSGVRRRQRRRFASPSPAAAARLSGAGMQVDA